MNALLELDEDDPDIFHLSKGFKYAFEVLKPSFYFIVLLGVLFFIRTGITIWEHKKRLMINYDHNKNIGAIY
jgi:hypothetical protein